MKQIPAPWRRGFPRRTATPGDLAQITGPGRSLWAHDEQQYSPSGLVSKMWADADWDERPVANQGTARWFQSDGLSLWNLAQRIHGEEAADDA
ncbi:hypothetical protein [Streptomyces sp. ALI-76-A]|uniref:hypothetical protein n=1 Tax=Streptomyces sp. ALI-76-A TaxID=3025736 RepID=UPI00256F2A90|nr:hypothetical protein [Streptomyces sp. ALI-76-A]MDL5201280.1 hypothetical protein [Streptomyces sp. ALI-76-A]